ncbi:hypothetical protein KUV51_18150 [Tateyamaria omphalii]|uniref:GspMb/PilO family protein n=1 Tax=Tateyamaria omphalii TaxID=299262 RepID=UPI001C993D61|nr:GspMb/PilO family protein [Tateyamaria omphalii]MBY5934931.1 hypothetical protein [Tateyamaria omphalii]
MLLTCALLTLAWIGLVEPAIAWKRDILREATRAENIYLQLVSGIRALEHDLQAVQSAPVEDVIWRASDGRAVVLEVQAALGRLAQDTGVTFSAVSPAQSELGMDAEVVALTLELRAPLDRILSLVKAIENHEPPLIVEAAAIRRTSGLGADTDQPVLQVSFRVAAVTFAEPVR